MFTLRGLAVSFSIFFLIYCSLSLLVGFVWRRFSAYGQRMSSSGFADWLFRLRLLPLVAAVGITLFFAVPSFLLLEPRSADEALGILPLCLGLCGVAVCAVGLWNAATSVLRTSRTIKKWSSRACLIERNHDDDTQSIPLLRTSLDAPPLTAAGILRPTFWLSAAAEFVLNERELRCALRHEVMHVRRRDNLRKFALRLVAFPGMEGMEALWRETTEMAADEAAVSNLSEALDLAAAVIKLSRIVPLRSSADLTTALVQSPAEALNARVQRLLNWNSHATTPAENRGRQSFAPYAAMASLLVLALTYNDVLVGVHAATEWLVR